MTLGGRRPAGVLPSDLHRGRGHIRPPSVEITWEYTGARDLLKIPQKIGGIGLEGSVYGGGQFSVGARLWWGPVHGEGQSLVGQLR